MNKQIEYWLVRCPRCHGVFITHVNIHSTKCRLCNYDFIVNLKKKHFTARVLYEAESLEEAQIYRSRIMQVEMELEEKKLSNLIKEDSSSNIGVV